MIWPLPNVKFKIGHTLNVKLESEVLLTSHAHQKVKITRHEKLEKQPVSRIAKGKKFTIRIFSGHENIKILNP